MKRAFFPLFFAVWVFSSFAQEIEFPDRSLFIEGAASSLNRTFFIENFTMEAVALGFNVMNNRTDAAYTFRFTAQADDDAFIILITLTENETNYELVSFGWPYTDINEMYEYNQYVLFKAVVLIPEIDEDELRGMLRSAMPDTRWRDQKFYLRVSLEYPMTFYGLIKGNTYKGEPYLHDNGGDGDFGYFYSESYHADIHSANNIFNPSAGAITIGAEFALINYFSFEPRITAAFEHCNEVNYLILSGGLDLKVPIKLKDNVMLAPYISLEFPLFFLSLSDFSFKPVNNNEVFSSFPPFGAGLGIQLNLRGGVRNALFFDIGYMFLYFGNDAGIRTEEGYLPHDIYYKRQTIRIGVGYKFGFFGPK